MSFISAQMARHLGAAGRIEESVDRAVTVRPSSTALLSVDSLDREQTTSGGASAGSFIINKNQSIFNGFFNRIALNEIVLDWCIDNVSDKYDPVNNVFSVTVGVNTYTATLANGNYTAAEILDEIIRQLNVAAGAGSFRVEDAAGNAWVVGTSSGVVYLGSTIGNFTIAPGSLASQMGIQTGVAGAAFPIACPKILPIYYIDFVSPQLTYNQDLKDNTTSVVTRDVLYRWVLAYDNVPIPGDKYNFPIFQGYKPFISRRYLNYPKQILWDPRQPVGQLSFEVYTSYGELIDPVQLEGEMEYQMSLLFSEN